jgi:hypothetical protein
VAKRNRLDLPLIVETLDAVASKFVGDENGVNTFFVSDRDGHIDTVTYDFLTAYKRWSTLAHGYRHTATLEDRQHGVLASGERDEETGRFEIFDDTETFKLR